MIHVPQLILDLALILGAAAITTLIFKKLKQPVVLGYIIAGVIVGPNFTVFPTISDVGTITVWAEIGVIFLLFTLGLEFSFKKLMHVGGSASITAVIEVIFMLAIGYLTGYLLGWSSMDSIFLGGILSISSTTIIIRAFEELNMKTKRFVGLVFGVLIIEDLVAILLLVLLSTLAVSQQFAGGEMVASVLKLSFFLIIWFLGGIFLLPTFFKMIRKQLNDETLLIISLALCLLMVIFATEVGFSPALGAFIMGSVLAETLYVNKIEHLIKSIKDLFGAVFFVSVGMLIDPNMLMNYAIPIAVITIVTIIGKSFSTLTGALISGQPLKQSIQAGFSLAQIGEFSFIIATLGLTLKVTSDFLYPIAVAVSAITTFSTPYLIASSKPVYNWLEQKLPAKWVSSLNRYSTGTRTLTSQSDWKIVLRSYMINLALNSVVITAIIALSVKFLAPFINTNITNGTWGPVITAVIALSIMAPFVWALATRRLTKAEYSNLWINKKYSGRGPIILLEIFRIGLALTFIIVLLNYLFPVTIAVITGLLVTVAVFLIFSRRLLKLYNRLEEHFLYNLNQKENEDNAPDPVKTLIPWDAHLAYFIVSPLSEYIGKTLNEIGIREKFGINIALIERGNIKIPVPARDERLFPMDKIAVIGTDEQLEQFRPHVEVQHKEDSAQYKDDVTLHQIFLDGRYGLVGKSIRESGIRERTNGLVVGIERNGQRLLNPDSATIFESGDIIWVAGIKDLIKELKKQEKQSAAQQ